MEPYSRGTPPDEYSLRVACEVSHQFVFTGSEPIEVVVRKQSCRLFLEDDRLVITTSGFKDLAQAKLFFNDLQGYLAHVSASQRVAILIPEQVLEPVETDITFFAEDYECNKFGWPKQTIKPILIYSSGAFVYPEHGFVAINKIFSIVPNFTYTVSTLAEAIAEVSRKYPSNRKVSDILLATISNYVHIRRSTQWVWRFLLCVTMLEMLSDTTKSTEETRSAVKSISKNVNAQYENAHLVDLDRIKSCLNQANTISITSAVKRLVKNHCAPGFSNKPLNHLFKDVEECDRKVAAIYNLRSTYVHEGRITSPKKVGYTFDELSNVAIEVLGHIISEMLAASE